MKLKERAASLLAKNPLGCQLLEEPHRLLLTAAAVLLMNLAYAVYNGILGAVLGSAWFGNICAYYIVLSVMRFSVVVWGRKGSAGTAMKLIGLLLVLLGAVLAVMVRISLAEGIASKYDSIPMITIAAYTFYRITMAAVQAVRRRKRRTPLFCMIQSIRCAEIAASVFSLQRSMYASFSSGQEQAAFILDVTLGFAVCLFVTLQGVLLIAARGR